MINKNCAIVQQYNSKTLLFIQKLIKNEDKLFVSKNILQYRFKSYKINLIRKRKRDNMDVQNTQYFRAVQEKKMDVKEVLRLVYEALNEKGYNPLNQIVGYVMSGDPTYITSHKSARSLIMKVERDEIVEELLKSYIDINLS